jgi:two-component system chemotaxis response regulator CheB
MPAQLDEISPQQLLSQYRFQHTLLAMVSRDRNFATGSTNSNLPIASKIVGIASSAGGIPALIEITSRLCRTSSVAFLIVQHVSEKYGSYLPSVLQRHCSLPVAFAQDGEIPCAGRIYVAPPGWHLTVTPNKRLALIKSELVHFSRPSADPLFFSLAQHYSKNACAVVLSGCGKDGSPDIRAVFSAGGLTFAQSPETAECDGMPWASIQTGCVRFVLSPRKIAQTLVSF